MRKKTPGGPHQPPDNLVQHHQETGRGGQPTSKDQRQQLAGAAILVLVERFGCDVARHLLDVVGRPDVIASFPRVMATQYAQQLHAEGLSPRDASYRIAELTGMSVRNARRYADAAEHEV